MGEEGNKNTSYSTAPSVLSSLPMLHVLIFFSRRHCCCAATTVLLLLLLPRRSKLQIRCISNDKQPKQGGPTGKEGRTTKLPFPPKQSSKKHASSVYSSSGFAATAAAAAPVGAAELLCCISTSRGTTSVARWWVLSRITSGALPACCACSHREEQRHLHT